MSPQRSRFFSSADRLVWFAYVNPEQDILHSSSLHFRHFTSTITSVNGTSSGFFCPGYVHSHQCSLISTTLTERFKHKHVWGSIFIPPLPVDKMVDMMKRTSEAATVIPSPWYLSEFYRQKQKLADINVFIQSSESTLGVTWRRGCGLRRSAACMLFSGGLNDGSDSPAALRGLLLLWVSDVIRLYCNMCTREKQSVRGLKDDKKRLT